MVRKIWIVVALAVAGVALTPDTAEAGRRRARRNNCCPQTCNPCCNPCGTGYGSQFASGCSSCSGCGGAMVGAPAVTTTAPPPVAAPSK
jgi:hypothetical protein